MREKITTRRVDLIHSIDVLANQLEKYKAASEKRLYMGSDVQWYKIPNGPSVLTMDGKTVLIEDNPNHASYVGYLVQQYSETKSTIFLDILRNIVHATVSLGNVIEKVNKKLKRLRILLRFTQYVAWVKKMRSCIRNQINFGSNDLEEDGGFNLIKGIKLINPFIQNPNETNIQQKLFYSNIR